MGLNEGVPTLHLAPTEWELREAGVGTGMVWSRRGVQLQKVGEMSRSGEGDGVETGTHLWGIRALAAASGADMAVS